MWIVRLSFLSQTAGVDKSQRVVLKPAYDLRLGDLGEQHIIAVRCFVCKWEGFVWPEKLRLRWEDNNWIDKISSRFKCSKCGNSVANSWEIRLLADGAEAPPGQHLHDQTIPSAGAEGSTGSAAGGSGGGSGSGTPTSTQ